MISNSYFLNHLKQSQYIIFRCNYRKPIQELSIENFTNTNKGLFTCQKCCLCRSYPKLATSSYFRDFSPVKSFVVFKLDSNGGNFSKLLEVANLGQERHNHHFRKVKTFFISRSSILCACLGFLYSTIQLIEMSVSMFCTFLRRSIRIV